jgi:hypothetical protein
MMVAVGFGATSNCPGRRHATQGSARHLTLSAIESFKSLTALLLFASTDAGFASKHISGALDRQLTGHLTLSRVNNKRVPEAAQEKAIKMLITCGMGVIGAEASHKFMREGHRQAIYARQRDESGQ